MTLGVADPQCPNRPTEVVSIPREERHRLMHLPVLTEPVGLPRLTRVLAPRRPVLTLHERRVDRPTARRRLQRGINRLLAPQHDRPMDRHDAVVLPLLADRRIRHTGVQAPLWQERTPTRPRRLLRR